MCRFSRPQPWEDVWLGFAISQLDQFPRVTYVDFSSAAFPDGHGLYAAAATLSWHCRMHPDFAPRAYTLEKWKELGAELQLCDFARSHLFCAHEKIRSCAGAVNRICRIRAPTNCSIAYHSLWPMRNNVSCANATRVIEAKSGSTSGSELGYDKHAVSETGYCRLKGLPRELMHEALGKISTEHAKARAEHEKQHRLRANGMRQISNWTGRALPRLHLPPLPTIHQVDHVGQRAKEYNKDGMIVA